MKTVSDDTTAQADEVLIVGVDEHENILIARDGIIVVGVPKIVEAKWPGTADTIVAALRAPAVRAAPMAPSEEEIARAIKARIREIPATNPAVIQFVPSTLSRVIDGSLLDRIATEAARAVLALLRSSPGNDGWQPIETAPRHYTPILLRQYETVGEGWHASHLDCWEFASAAHTLRRHPTHWKPLPAPPQTSGQPRD